jgi:hypothetical protein
MKSHKKNLKPRKTKSKLVKKTKLSRKTKSKLSRKTKSKLARKTKRGGYHLQNELMRDAGMASFTLTDLNDKYLNDCFIYKKNNNNIKLKLVIVEQNKPGERPRSDNIRFVFYNKNNEWEYSIEYDMSLRGFKSLISDGKIFIDNTECPIYNMPPRRTYTNNNNN